MAGKKSIDDVVKDTLCSYTNCIYDKNSCVDKCPAYGKIKSVILFWHKQEIGGEMVIEKELLDVILCEIKGLLFDNYGNPNRELDTAKKIDIFIDEVEEVIKNIKGVM